MIKIFTIVLVVLTITFSKAAIISGFVTDSTNGEALIGANIFFKDLQMGTYSNAQGYFVIQPVPTGRHTLIINYLSYRKNEMTIDFSPGDKRFVNVALVPEAIAGEEVIVSGTAISDLREVQLSRVDLSAKSIRSAPQFGEADLFRTLQALPGVVSESDFSTGLVVRGGNTDQNLIMLDGITVYNPSHMGGLFSNFLLDAIKDAQFIKGGFPAEYGGRMSSVLNVISKAGNSQEISGSAGISLISSRGALEVPVSKGALLLAGRRTYFDQALKLMNKEFPYYFYDFQGSFFQDLSQFDRLTVSGYFGNDVFDWDELEFDLQWGNRTLSANWRHIFSPQLFSNFMIAASRFSTEIQLGGDQGVDSKNRIQDYTLKGDLSYFFSLDNNIKFGFEYKKLDFQYRDVYDNRNLFSLRQKPAEMAVYIQDDWKIHPKLVLKPGIRTSYFSRRGTNFYVEPRFSLKYQLRANEYFSFATGLYRQFIFTVQDEYNPNIINNWFAVDQTVKPGRSLHFIVGYERELWSTTLFQFEVYYKTLDNMLTYREQRSSVDETVGDDIKAIEFFIPTDGYSYGVEMFIHKKYGKLAGWLGYTLNWARKTLDNSTYFASFDRRHNLNVVMSFELGRKWRSALRFNYGSGFPFTRVEGSYEERDGGIVRRRLLYGERNKFRYPAYHRLDLSFTKDFKWINLDWQFEIQLVNVYNNENIFIYEWDFDENPAERTDITMLPFIPTVGISVNF